MMVLLLLFVVLSVTFCVTHARQVTPEVMYEAQSEPKYTPWPKRRATGEEKGTWPVGGSKVADNLLREVAARVMARNATTRSQLPVAS